MTSEKLQVLLDQHQCISVQLYATLDAGVPCPLTQMIALAKMTEATLDPGTSPGPCWLLLHENTDLEGIELILNDYGFVWQYAHESFVHAR